VRPVDRSEQRRFLAASVRDVDYDLSRATTSCYEIARSIAFCLPPRRTRSCPGKWCTKDDSTNPLERLNAKIKRRTDAVGIFPNEAAIVRLVGALLLEQNNEWQLQRRYLQLEGLQALGDNSTREALCRDERIPALRESQLVHHDTGHTTESYAPIRNSVCTIGSGKQ
jgi:hypothetical protein